MFNPGHDPIYRRGRTSMSYPVPIRGTLEAPSRAC